MVKIYCYFHKCVYATYLSVTTTTYMSFFFLGRYTSNVNYDLFVENLYVVNFQYFRLQFFGVHSIDLSKVSRLSKIAAYYRALYLTG